jgi:ubiquinone biosynthesis protein UbiJ
MPAGDADGMKTRAMEVIERALSRALSRLLASDADVAARLARLAGTVIEFRLRDTPVRVHVRPTADGVRISTAHEGTTDVRVSGRLSDFIAYARASRRGDPLAAGRIEISGDLAVAQNVQALLAALDIDFEELLSDAIGDVPAHQLGRFARAAGGWTRAVGAKLERDLAEYLQHEARLLPQRHEVERLGRAIRTLAADVERLEARLRARRFRAR